MAVVLKATAVTTAAAVRVVRAATSSGHIIILFCREKKKLQ